jgi:transcriptional regulator with XRE-family HTH domain
MSEFGAELGRLMVARGLGVRELARQVPCNAGYISQLRNGQKRPSQETAARLDEVLDSGGTLVVLVPERASRSRLASADADGGVIGACDADASLELIEFMRRAGRSDLGSDTLEALDVVKDRLCRAYPTVAAPVLRDQARKYLGYTVGLLDQRTTLGQHRELLVSAGWLAALLACVCYDAGDPAAAKAARRMTKQLGEQAGHGELVGWAFEIAAWFALVEGRYADTVALCEAGLGHAGVSNGGVQLTLQASRGYARMGDRRAGQMLAAGRGMLSRLPEPAHPEHHFVFDRDKYEFYTATVYTWLGTDDAAAVENAREVVARCVGPDGAVRWPTRLSTTLVNLGEIAGRRGDLDEAVGLGVAALGCGRRSAELLPRAAELEHMLAAQYPGERLVGTYEEALSEEVRALRPEDAQRLQEAVDRRTSGRTQS